MDTIEEKKLEEFKNEFIELMSKYPEIMLSQGINGWLGAYFGDHRVWLNSK
jgi:hypothetical protein